jgi:HAD superfamily hydrolase (TIGR01490 family)
VDLALFDLDNTLLAGDSDYEWAQFLIDRGVVDRARYEAENDRFYAQYEAGTLDIFEFLDFQLAPLALHPRAQLDAWHAEYMAAKVRPMIAPGTSSLVERHRAAGARCAIITATNSFVTAPIARELGVAHLIATEPETRGPDGAFTGKVAGIPCFREGKVARLEQWLASMGTPLEEFATSWFYSDSHNDLPLLELVGHPVAVDPDQTLRALASSRGWPIISLRD